MNDSAPVKKDSDFEIYCDLDGVLVDFFGALKQLTGGKNWNESIRDLGIDEVWRLINLSESKWWADLEWMKDGQKLWEFLSDKNPTILTASSTSRTGDRAIKGKEIWCTKHLGASTKVIIADHGHDKKNWAGPKHILIDDLEENIRPWREAGGIGIQHQNAAQTISELGRYYPKPGPEKPLKEDWKALAAAGLMGLGALSSPGTAAGATVIMPRHSAPVEKAVVGETMNMNIFAATLIGEAGGEGVRGMQAVANVIMNRTDGKFSKASEVCLKPMQFSMWNKKQDQLKEVISKAQQHSRWKDAILLVMQARDGKLIDITDKSRFYFNPKLASPAWAKKLTKTVVIGNHDFYR